MIYGLIFGCPFMKEHDDCPFKIIREMPKEARIRYIDQMDQTEICDLIERHSECLYFRKKKAFEYQDYRFVV